MIIFYFYVASVQQTAIRKSVHNDTTKVLSVLIATDTGKKGSWLIRICSHVTISYESCQ